MTPYEMTSEDVVKINNFMVIWSEAEFETDNLAVRILDNENDWPFKSLSRNKTLLVTPWKKDSFQKRIVAQQVKKGLYLI
jgi:hypothetical protein